MPGQEEFEKEWDEANRKTRQEEARTKSEKQLQEENHGLTDRIVEAACTAITEHYMKKIEDEGANQKEIGIEVLATTFTVGAEIMERLLPSIIMFKGLTYEEAISDLKKIFSKGLDNPFLQQVTDYRVTRLRKKMARS